MNLVLTLALALAGAAAPASPSAETGGSLYVQVIRGTDDTQPKEKSWRRIGPKLGAALSRAFKWHHFYEVKQKAVPVVPGTTATVRLDSERELRIHFKSEREAELQLYRNGKLTRKAAARLKDLMSILGADGGEKDAWFVVVRSDKPTTE